MRVLFWSSCFSSNRKNHGCRLSILTYRIIYFKFHPGGFRSGRSRNSSMGSKKVDSNNNISGSLNSSEMGRKLLVCSGGSFCCSGGRHEIVSAVKRLLLFLSLHVFVGQTAILLVELLIFWGEGGTDQSLQFFSVRQGEGWSSLLLQR